MASGLPWILRQHFSLCRVQEAVEAPKHRKRKDYLAVLISLVRAAKEITDRPDEVSQMGMGLCGH